MRKISIIFLIAVILLFVSVLDSKIHAEENNIDLTPYGGLVYTNFADEDFEGEIDLSSAFGFKAGGRMGFTKEFSGALEYLQITSSDTSEGMKAELNVKAIRGNIGINIDKMIQKENIPSIRFKGGTGYYFGQYDAWILNMDLKGSMGFDFGLEVEQEIAEGLNLKGDIGYRILKMEPEDMEDEDIETEPMNLNGIEIGGGISYNF